MLEKEDIKKFLPQFPMYSFKEELASSLIHGFGILFSISALTILVAMSVSYGNTWSVVSSAIFGATLILMYTASTIYHAVSYQPAKKGLKKFDHIAIYYAIAGGYTPFLLVLLRTGLGWTVFGLVYGLAILGTILKLMSKSTNGKKAWSIGLYLGMGWIMVLCFKKMIAVIPKIGLIFLVLGGVSYTLGIVFYLWKSKKYTHSIWHGFVLLGSIMHFFAVLYSCVLLNR